MLHAGPVEVTIISWWLGREVAGPIRHLDLSDNHVGEEGAAALIRAMESTSTLLTVKVGQDLSCNPP